MDWTQTFLPIIQRDTVAAVIVAALMYQPPRSAVLAVVHDGDGFRLAFFMLALPPTPAVAAALAGMGLRLRAGGRVCRFRQQRGRGRGGYSGG